MRPAACSAPRAPPRALHPTPTPLPRRRQVPPIAIAAVITSAFTVVLAYAGRFPPEVQRRVIVHFNLGLPFQALLWMFSPGGRQPAGRTAATMLRFASAVAFVLHVTSVVDLVAAFSGDPAAAARALLAVAENKSAAVQPANFMVRGGRRGPCRASGGRSLPAAGRDLSGGCATRPAPHARSLGPNAPFLPPAPQMFDFLGTLGAALIFTLAEEGAAGVGRLLTLATVLGPGAAFGLVAARREERLAATAAAAPPRAGAAAAPAGARAVKED
jgi:hypothetical protein